MQTVNNIAVATHTPVPTVQIMQTLITLWQITTPCKASTKVSWGIWKQWKWKTEIVKMKLFTL